MTVAYMKSIAEANIWTFIRLLFRWRGSVWKSIHRELFAYLIIYLLLLSFCNVVIRDTAAEMHFKTAVESCNKLRPILFTAVGLSMAFFVTQVYNRWWSVFMMLPWPDTLVFEICAYFRDRKGKKQKKDDEHARQTISRHLSLSFVLVFRDISERVRVRFPTLDCLVGSLLTENEKHYLEKESIHERHYWIPIEWISHILKKAYARKQIDDIHYTKMIQSLLDYRERLHNVLQFDNVNLPLVYTQVVHLVTYVYFLARLIGAIRIDRPSLSFVELLPIPVFTILEFIVLIGWLKAGEVMLNPFGMDDDDFDMDILIERNFIVATCALSSNIFDSAPQLADLEPQIQSDRSDSLEEDRPKNVLQGSAVGLQVPEDEQKKVSIFYDKDSKAAVVIKEKSSIHLYAPPPLHLSSPPPNPQASTPIPVVAPFKEVILDKKVSPSTERIPFIPKISKEKTSRRNAKGSSDTMRQLETPHVSRAEPVDTLKESSQQKVAPMEDVAERLEQWRMKKSIEKKRNQMAEQREVDSTQLDEGEHFMSRNNSVRPPSPKNSMNPSLVSPKTQKKTLSIAPTPQSTQTTQRSVLSKNSRR